MLAPITRVGPWTHVSARELVLANALVNLYERLAEPVPELLSAEVVALKSLVADYARRGAGASAG